MLHLKAHFLKEVVIVTNSPTARAYTLRMQDIIDTGSTTITNFEEFRINKCVVTVIPEQTNTLPQNLATGPFLPSIIDAIDYTDENVITQSNVLLRLDSARVHVGDKAWSRKFTPALNVLGASTTNTVNLPKFKQWVATTTPAELAEFLSYKILIAPAAGQTGTFKFSVWMKIYYSVKGIH